MTDSADRDVQPPPEQPALAGRRVAFWGKLGGLNRREAQQLVRDHGGVPCERLDARPDLLVVGAEEFPVLDLEALGAEAQQAVASGSLEIIPETQLWERLGLLDDDPQVRRLYTPGMLAELLQVPVATIRRWHRRGLIVPAREVRRLPYFDFAEVATARRLAQLVANGASPAEIERKLAAIARLAPGVERPLAQLSVIVEGRDILLREGEGLIEPGGQLRFDFDSLEAADDQPQSVPLEARGESSAASRGGEQTAESVIAFHPDSTSPATPAELLRHAAICEEEGYLDDAIDAYRAALAAGGPDAEVCFLLAEGLYRQGRVEAAKERYYMAIEIDEDYVEARANLGCVLAESGELELAAAAFVGALARHDDYPDVHFHLARVLDDLGRCEEAEGHWRRFVALTPDSPWADEARRRLESR